MKRRYSKKPKKQLEEAEHQIKRYFALADKAFAEDKGLANRYVALARKMAMRFKIKLPKTIQRKFCKHCYKYLMPGVNCRIRTNSGKVVYYCMECKKYMRFQYR